MSGYSTVEDVQRLVKWITFTATSKLTNDDIENMIKEADGKINGTIGQVYQIPVTDETDKVILSYASARLAAYEAAKVLIAQAGGDLPAIVQEWKTSAEEYLAKIRSRDIILENTPRRAIESSSAIYSHTAHDPAAPKKQWELGKDQW